MHAGAIAVSELNERICADCGGMVKRTNEIAIELGFLAATWAYAGRNKLIAK